MKIKSVKTFKKFKQHLPADVTIHNKVVLSLLFLLSETSEDYKTTIEGAEEISDKTSLNNIIENTLQDLVLNSITEDRINLQTLPEEYTLEDLELTITLSLLHPGNNETIITKLVEYMPELSNYEHLISEFYSDTNYSSISSELLSIIDIEPIFEKPLFRTLFTTDTEIIEVASVESVKPLLTVAYKTAITSKNTFPIIVPTFKLAKDSNDIQN